jgi:hypothetical protein
MQQLLDSLPHISGGTPRLPPLSLARLRRLPLPR